MAITLFLVRDRAKASDNPTAGLGKSPGEIANHGRFALLGLLRAKTPYRLGKKFRRTRQSWPFSSTAAVGLVKQSGMALVVGVIDDKRPQLRVSPFLGVETQ